MTDSKTWLANIDRIRYNPSAIQRLSLSSLEAAMGGNLDIVDPTNPFVFLMEASSINAAAAMIDNEANTRKQYPSMALTEDELYLHMSDIDYAGRFASPARTTFTILLGKEELYNRVVNTGVGNVRKLTIPRHTEFTIAGVKFTMQYPIDIRVMAHGGLQIVYDVDNLSPLQTLSTNIVDWTVVNIQGVEFIKLDIPVSQFEITPQYGQLNNATGFNKTFSYSNQFYYARVFAAQADGSWKEIRTTHTDQVFDPLVPTAVLKVTAGKLNVSIPQVYLTTQLVNTELRVDIYTTRGPLDMILGNYQMNNFTVRWVDLDGTASSKFVAPLSSYATMAIYSDSVVSGGANGLSFEKLRERVMLNAMGVPNLPITNVQLTSRLEDLGYQTVKDVDNITNRQFLATRVLPKPTDDSVVSGAGCTIQTLSASMVDLAAMDTVRDNGNRITILPKTLYQNINGLLQIVPTVAINALMANPLDVRARKINESRYLYSPFHYVLDMNDDRFDLRGYYLDAPSIEAKSFVEENDTVGIEVGTGSYKIERVDNGYKLTVVCRSSDAWKALSDEQALCQLSYIPTGEKDRAYLNGELVATLDGERMYQFDLETNYDIDAIDNIIVTNFSMYNDPERKHPTPLTTDFDIMYIAADIDLTGMATTTIDKEMGKELLPEIVIGISRERLKVRLGDALHRLWTASRSVVSSLDYQRYAADVPALWEETVFQRDPVTGALDLTVDGEGNVQYVILHNQGDPVLDENGDPVIKWHKGDPILDGSGEPLVISSRKMVRQCDLFLIDGVYWFATEAAAVAYRDSLPVTVVNWLRDDITTVSQFLLEQTNLFFYPKSTLGQVSVIVKEDQQSTVTAEQSFSVVYYLTGQAYRDTELRTSLSKMAIETINEVLQNQTVTTNEMVSKLTAKAGGDAIAVEISGLGGSNPQAAMTLEDNSARLSIKKVAVALADGTIGVADDVAVTFLQHTAG